MGKRSGNNYGKCVVRGAESINTGKCRECGTFNPSIPGEGLVEKCAGCGTSLASEVRVKADAFCPPKPGKIDELREDGVTKRTAKRWRKNTYRLHDSMKDLLTKEMP